MICGSKLRAPKLNPPVNKRDLSTGENGEKRGRERSNRECQHTSYPGLLRPNRRDIQIAKNLRNVGDRSGPEGVSMPSTKPLDQFVFRSLGSPPRILTTIHGSKNPKQSLSFCRLDPTVRRLREEFRLLRSVLSLATFAPPCLPDRDY